MPLLFDFCCILWYPLDQTAVETGSATFQMTSPSVYNTWTPGALHWKNCAKSPGAVFVISAWQKKTTRDLNFISVFWPPLYALLSAIPAATSHSVPKDSQDESQIFFNSRITSSSLHDPWNVMCGDICYKSLPWWIYQLAVFTWFRQKPPSSPQKDSGIK